MEPVVSVGTKLPVGEVVRISKYGVAVLLNGVEKTYSFSEIEEIVDGNAN